MGFFIKIIKRKKLPNQERLHALLKYGNGNLYWRRTMNGYVKAGDVAGAKDKKRYRVIKIDYRHYLLHRIIWKYFNNSEPSHIDHINGNILDNKIENLQEINHSLNKIKSNNLYKNNTSGMRGVHYRKDIMKWRAMIYINKDKITLGYFNNIHGAARARERAENELLKNIKR